MKTLFVSLLLLSSIGFAEDGAVPTRQASMNVDDLIEVESWEKLNVNARGQGRVYRFVDRVEGQKVVCYVTDTSSPFAVAPSVHCLKLD